MTVYEQDFCTELILLVSNLCGLIVTFLTVDRYVQLTYG
jgi:hypothetical protein